MARYVFGSHSQTAHVWAQGRQAEGRSGDGRVFWSGRQLFSHGRHWTIGLLLPGSAGDAIINRESRSVSTTRHTWEALRAVRGRTYDSAADFSDIAGRLELLSDAPTGTERDTERRAQYAEDVQAWTLKHAAKLDPETGAKLLELAGAKNPAKAFAALVEKRAKLDAAAKLAAEAAERESRRNETARIAAMSDAEIRDWFRRMHDSSYYQAAQLGNYNWRTGGRGPDVPAQWSDSSPLTRAAKRFRALKIQAKSDGRTRQLAALKTRERELKVYAAKALRNAGRAPVQERTRETIRALRAIIATLAPFADNLPAALEATAWGTLADWTRTLEAVRANGAQGGGRRNLARWIRPKNHQRLLQLEIMIAPVQARKRAENDARLQREEAERIAARARIAAERQEREAAARADWLAGIGPRIHGATWRDDNGGALLRAVDVQRDDSGRITGGTLETSLGAEVPLTHAVRAFAFLRLCRETGRTWTANGKALPVGHFRIESVRPDGFKAGCHWINWNEVERIALALGVFETVAASDVALTPSRELAAV